MKKLLFLNFVLCIFIISLQSYAQFSQQQATNLVLNQILSGELDQIDVYIFDDTLAVEDPVTLASGDNISLPYSSCWVYFVDDGPFMNWVHPCRFIFVCDSTGNYSITEKDYFPIRWDSTYNSVSMAPRPTPIELQQDTSIRIEEVDPDPNKYAVLICGEDRKRFRNNTSALYCTLIDIYGFTKSNIFVHYEKGYSLFPDNDLDDPDIPSDDIDYSAYKDTIQHTFNELSGITNTSTEIPVLDEDDQLFICFFGHGGMTENQEKSFIFLPKLLSDTNYKLYDSIFAHFVEDVNCSQIIVLMNNCQGGEFITKLMDFENYNVKCKNRSVHTASDNEAAHPELWITENGYDEMAYYWTAAARGYYPVTNEPWNELCEVGEFPFDSIEFDTIHPADYHPDLNNDGIVQMEEAFAYANNWNSWSEEGFYCLKENPPADTNGIDDPQCSVNISFSDTLLSLAGISGIVKESKTIENRSYTLCGPLTIDSNTTITLEGGTSIYMVNDTANITVDEGASLVCQDGYTYITGLTEDNKITINGSFTPGDNNTFDHVPEIMLNNPNAQTNFNNVTFTDTTILKNYGDSLSIDSSLVENCLGVYSFASDVHISNTRLVNSSVVVSNSGETTSHSITVEDCDFDYLSSNAMAAIKLMCCDEYLYRRQ
jgi:hypothetical protein